MPGPGERRRIVIDTNVVVAALLHPGRTPAAAIELAMRELEVVVDARIEAEYRDVLERPKFARIPREAREAMLARLLDPSVRVEAARYGGTIADEDDRAFVEVALGGRAEVLLTGNGRDFPKTLGFEVLAPAELLARFTVATGAG